jgi:hypothetical protein
VHLVWHLVGAAVVVPAPVQQGGKATSQASVVDAEVAAAVAAAVVVARVNVHFREVKHLALQKKSSWAQACAMRCLSARLWMLALRTVDDS